MPKRRRTIVRKENEAFSALLSSGAPPPPPGELKRLRKSIQDEVEGPAVLPKSKAKTMWTKIRVIVKLLGLKSHADKKLMHVATRAWKCIKTEFVDQGHDVEQDKDQVFSRSILLAGQIGKFWHLVSQVAGDGKSYCTEQQYLELNRRLYKALIPGWEQEDEEKLISSSSTDCQPLTTLILSIYQQL